MTKYTAVAAKEASIGQGVNGMGRRVWITGAYTLNQAGKPCRAFTDKEGGLDAAQKWADELNRRYGLE